MVDLNPTILINTLNVNDQNTRLKGRDWNTRVKRKKARLTCICKKNPF